MVGVVEFVAVVVVDSTPVVAAFVSAAFVVA